MRYSVRTKSAILIGVSVILLSAMVSCRSGVKQSAIIPIPEFRYPGMEYRNNLNLITVLTDPYGKSFLQGNLRPKKTKGKHNLRKPYAAVMAGPDLLFLLDNARGVAYRLSFDTGGNIVNTSVYPEGRRQFPSLVDFAITPDSNLWLVDSKLKTVFVINMKGNIVDSISADFERPVGIAFQESSGQVLITDLIGNSISVFSLDRKLVGKHNSENGLMLESPSFITSDDDGRVYVVEALTAFVKIIGADWKLERSIGGIGDGPGYFAKPKGIAVDKMKRLYVADALFDNVQIFDSTGTLLLALGTTGDRAGEFWQPSGLHIDEQQRLFVADSYNRRVQVFRWEKGE